MIDVSPIIDSFEKVIETLDKLAAHITTDLKDYPIWADEKGGNLHRKVANALTKLDILNDAAPGAVYTFPAVVGCTPDTLELIGAVNEAKSEFSEISTAKMLEAGCVDHSHKMRQILNRAGYRAIARKHVLRKIHFIRYQPRQVAWRLCKNGSWKAISIAEAEKMLINKKQGDAIDIQLKALRNLNASDKLVIYKPIAQRHRVHIIDDMNVEHIATSIPLFYICNPDKDQPEVSFKALNKRHQSERKSRSDQIIKKGTKPFLPSIGAYLIQ